jgi:hypothetical protein
VIIYVFEGKNDKKEIGERKMIKGAQKKMIVIKTDDSTVFEEAYFVVRHSSTATRGDMIAEAERRIDESGEKKAKRRKPVPLHLVLASLSIAFGGLIGSLLTLFVTYLAGI